jgi:transposase InsO family protein
MAWKECSMVSQREELVELAMQPEANVSRLCRSFGISRKTGYKWIGRRRRQEPMSDLSRRPRRSPRRSAAAVEAAALAVRAEHPAWRGRKIRHVLVLMGHVLMGGQEKRPHVPAASTITAILRRHGKIDPAESLKHAPCRRFEHAAPNDLWQMDFKGHFALADGTRCHPLTVLDDHSRFNLALRACRDERGTTVQRELMALFQRYGLPRRMLMDNGSPWGCDAEHTYTPLTVWLLRLDIAVSHGRPLHPQTQGKEERFHRTLKVELLRDRVFDDRPHCQQGFDRFRDVYNLKRPHEALGMKPPVTRYRPSERAMPPHPPPIEYPAGDQVRKVQDGGWISYRGREHHLPQAFVGHPVGLRATEIDGVLDAYFCHHRIGRVDCRSDPPDTPAVATFPTACPADELQE